MRCCIIPIAAAKADSTGRRNTQKLEVVMTTYRRASDRCTRKMLRAPGRPPAWQRENHRRFWQAIALGRSSEGAAAEARGWIQLVNATPFASLAPGVMKPSVFLGRVFSFNATAFKSV